MTSTSAPALQLPPWWSSDAKKAQSRLLEILRVRFTEERASRIRAALEVAEAGHAGQVRAGGAPYIVHPVRVILSLILEFHLRDEEILAAGLLHDVLEDCAGVPADLRDRFSPRTWGIVESLTRTDKRLPGGDRLIHPYLQGLVTAGSESILVKIADKLDNLRDALNHPRAEKRRLYVEEGYKTFLLLSERLEDPGLRERASSLLFQAMENHSSFRPFIAWRHYTATLATRFRDLDTGDHIPHRSLSQEVFRLDDSLDFFLLLNPRLPFWLNSDGVEVIKIGLNPRGLACNVAGLICAKIGRDEVSALLALTSQPLYLAEARSAAGWQRVRRQLQLFIELLGEEDPPAWLRPLREHGPGLLAVLHAHLFLPASWSFPLWHLGFGASLVEQSDDLFRQTCDLEPAAAHRRFISLLLRNRLALLRFYRGIGSRQRLADLLAAFDAASLPGVSREVLLAARLLAEYLELAVSGEEDEDRLRQQCEVLWQALSPEADSLAAADLPRAAELGLARHGDLQLRDADLMGLPPILAVGREEGVEPQLRRLIDLLLEPDREADAESLWLCFDVEEILKRRQVFFTALRRLPAEPGHRDLAAEGIQLDEDRFGTVRVRMVRPAPGLALRNRLPEIAPEELARMRTGRFSATAIFDTLLLARLKTPPVWTPRVFRILDSMADLDPAHVQPIRISFESPEQMKSRMIPLPLPAAEGAEADRQERRKKIVARFIAVTIYNSAIATSVASARVECALLEPRRRRFGFTTSELVEQLAAMAAEYGYDAYARFVQGFNFRPFTVTAGGPGDEDVSFAGPDMAYGAFLGIDIGGTAIKFCLFERGDPAAHSVRTIPTFAVAEGAVPISSFVDRILDEVERYLAGKLPWSKLNGIGLSWPGAVRDSRIVGFSRTLGRLAVPLDGELRTLGHDASPQEIQSVDLVRTFHQCLRQRGSGVSDLLAITIDNDGNAEAYGNFSLIEMQGGQVPGGKVVIKLGTSLAGGHIDSFGAISPHVSEFSKTILEFSEPAGPRTGIQGAARDWVSSSAVRQLSRSFTFDGEVLFGPLDGQNDSDEDVCGRIEAVEIGELLGLWRLVDDEPIRESRLLRELTAADNRQGGERAAELRQHLRTAQEAGAPGLTGALVDYVYRRGCERLARLEPEAAGEVQERCAAARARAAAGARLQQDERGELEKLWKMGIERLLLLAHGRPTTFTGGLEELPAELEPHRLATMALGAVALMSQVGLHTAHLVILLYNLYRKRRMQGVILAGGVLFGLSGRVVHAQTEAFLAKYYDKIYGPTKNLTPDSIRLAQVDDPAVVGPLGAAMSANRLHKIQARRALRQEIGHLVDLLAPGGALRLAELLPIAEPLRAGRVEIQAYLEELVASSRLLPFMEQEEAYLKM